jgi:hypothetical protein
MEEALEGLEMLTTYKYLFENRRVICFWKDLNVDGREMSKWINILVHKGFYGINTL